MFDDLKVNDQLSIYSNRGGYDFDRVYFVDQSEDSITVLDFVPNQEIEIPKSYIVEIKKYPKGWSHVNIRYLINELELHAMSYGDDCTVKLFLGIEGQLLDEFTISHYEDKEIHINSSESKKEYDGGI